MGPLMGNVSAALRRFLTRERSMLLAILLAAATLRLWGLGSVPPGVYCDEAAMGTNAKMLGLTGRTLKGEVLPLWVHEATFERYQSYQIVYQPVYQYTLVPFVRLFGLSSFVVRLPSVLYGVLGVLAVYLFGRGLYGATVGLAAAGLLAISPWHHHYSRICFEVISLPVFLAFGFHLLFRGLERPRCLAGGAVLLALSTYAYPAGRLFVPILLLTFAALHPRELWGARRAVLAAAGAAALVAVPNLYVLLTDPNQGRMHNLFIWGTDIANENAVLWLREAAKGGGWAATVLESRPLLLPFVFGFNWLSHLSPSFLFISGDGRAIYAAQGLGMCYFFVAPLLAMGLWTLARRWRERKGLFLLAWFLTWPIPASLTIHAPHGTRGMTNFPVIEIISAVGLVAIFTAARPAFLPPRSTSWKVALAAVAACYVAIRVPIEVTGYLRNYHREFPVYAAKWFDQGVGDGIRRLAAERREGEELYVSPRVHNAYLNILFFADVDYRALDPRTPDHDGLLPTGWHVAWPEKLYSREPKGLWLIQSEEKEEHPKAQVVAKIDYPDGAPHLYVLRYPAR